MKQQVLLAGFVAYTVCGAAGCALTSKADIVEIRYFSPEVVRPRLAVAPAPGEAVVVRLGRVSSGPNLRERIAYRDDAHEIGYYEDKRWTERPEAFVRRQLGHALYESHGFKRVVGGSGPTVEVEVVAFDELRSRTGRAARVQLNVILLEGSAVLYEDTVTVDQPITTDKPNIEDVVGAMASALEIATEQIATRVGTEVAGRRVASRTAAP